MTVIDAAAGQTGLDLLVKNVRLANVLSGEIYPADVGVFQGRIAAVEPAESQPNRRANIG